MPFLIPTSWDHRTPHFHLSLFLDESCLFEERKRARTSKISDNLDTVYEQGTDISENLSLPYPLRGGRRRVLSLPWSNKGTIDSVDISMDWVGLVERASWSVLRLVAWRLLGREHKWRSGQGSLWDPRSRAMEFPFLHIHPLSRPRVSRRCDCQTFPRGTRRSARHDPKASKPVSPRPCGGSSLLSHFPFTQDQDRDQIEIIRENVREEWEPTFLKRQARGAMSRQSGGAADHRRSRLPECITPYLVW